MVKFTRNLPFVAVLVAAGVFAVPQLSQAAQSRAQTGDSLLIHRVQQEKTMNLPKRGLSMGQVEKTWGAPQRKLSPRGGASSKQPQINRWEYSNFIVYFEHNHVIHSVLNTPAGNNTDPSAIN